MIPLTDSIKGFLPQLWGAGLLTPTIESSLVPAGIGLRLNRQFGPICPYPLAPSSYYLLLQRACLETHCLPFFRLDSQKEKNTPSGWPLDSTMESFERNALIINLGTIVGSEECWPWHFLKPYCRHNKVPLDTDTLMSMYVHQAAHASKLSFEEVTLGVACITWQKAVGSWFLISQSLISGRHTQEQTSFGMMSTTIFCHKHPKLASLLARRWERHNLNKKSWPNQELDRKSKPD